MKASKLTLFEQYMLADDHPATPMNVLLRLHFTGQFKTNELKEALKQTLVDHPLLTAKVHYHKGNWYWQPQTGDLPFTECHHTPASPWTALSPLDLENEPGFHLYRREDETQTELLFHVHHSTSDALGLLNVAADLLTHYHNLITPSDQLATTSRDPALLKVRHRFSWPRLHFMRGFIEQMRDGIPLLRRFLRIDAHSLTSPPPCFDHSQVNPEFPTSQTIKLSKTDSEQLKQISRKHGVTLNDLLIAGFFLSLSQHPSTEEATTKPHIRLCIPVNLRPNDNHAMPAANQVSLSFIDYPTDDIHPTSDFLQSVHKHMATIKKNKLGLTFLIGLTLQKLKRGSMEKVCTPHECQTTAVLTNPGIVFNRHPLSNENGELNIGSLHLDSLDILSPTRPHTNLTIATYTYAGQLNLCAHYDPRLLNHSQVQTILDDCITGMKHWE